MDGTTSTARPTGVTRRSGPGEGKRPRGVGVSEVDRIRPTGLSSGGAEEQMGATDENQRPKKGRPGADFADSTVPGGVGSHSAWAKAQVGKVKHHKTRVMRCAKLLSYAVGAMQEVGIGAQYVETVATVRSIVMDEYWKEVEKDRMRLKDYNRLKQKEHRKG